jgi:Tfp pilus assembly protein PilF
MLANISSQNGDLLKAKKLFEKAMILNPGNQEINHGYGILLLKLNQHAKGLDHIRKGTGFVRFSSESYKII